MTLRDWRGLAPAVVRDHYERERRHWHRALGWDTAWTWETVEQARVAGTLPGFVAFDASGVARGWTFFVVDGEQLHIGGLVADSAAATAALLDEALQAGSAVDACFILDRAEGLQEVLAARGFDVEPFHYLSRTMAGVSAEAGEAEAEAAEARSSSFAVVLADSWRDTDREGFEGLLEAAYPRAAAVHFAPDGNWYRYVSGLMHQAGCGIFDAALSRVVRGERRMNAAVIATSLSATTAHIAQLAVHPELQGRGLASALVRQTVDAAARAGKTELTLLVGDRNSAGRRLYAANGFAARATFVAARREDRGSCRHSLSA